MKKPGETYFIEYYMAKYRVVSVDKPHPKTGNIFVNIEVIEGSMGGIDHFIVGSQIDLDSVIIS